MDSCASAADREALTEVFMYCGGTAQNQNRADTLTCADHEAKLATVVTPYHSIPTLLRCTSSQHNAIRYFQRSKQPKTTKTARGAGQTGNKTAFLHKYFLKCWTSEPAV